MPPDWLETIAWVSLALAAICAALVAWDILGRGYRQPMRIMEAVWPITALYLGPLGLLAYRRWGRPKSNRYQREHGETGRRPFAVRVGVSASHCGAGCTLGDIIATWVVFAAGLTVAGLALPYEYLFDFTFALALGIAFQFWSIRPMRPELARGEVVRRALKADSLSLTAFEIGLFGWMAIMQLVLFTDPHLPPDTASYWFLMQVGMALGFLTTYPVNIWLIRRGIKEAMS
ncbi:MAG: DUF4396 domain-containing protein [Solirubrobacterales bacterium]|nr:DUF4396 domain-containing protein [Solirubrobacterales bacterium]